MPSLEELVNDAMLPIPIVVRGIIPFGSGETSDSISLDAQ